MSWGKNDLLFTGYSQDEKADVCDVGKCVSGTRKHLQNAKLSSRSVNAESVKDTSCTGRTACTLLQRWIERAPVQVRCPKSICKCENSPGGTWCFSYLRMIVHGAQKYLPNRQSCWTSHDRSLPAQPVPLSEEPLCRRTACADRGASAATVCTLVFSRPVCSPCRHEKARMRPLFGRRAPHGSCLAGEPGTTCCRRLYRSALPSVVAAV